MKILICGLGSIGKRHAKNLMDVGEKNLIFFRERNLKLEDKELRKIKNYNNLDAALMEKPKLTFICNTTSKHIKTAIKCAEIGSHLFIEKPLSNNFKKFEVLERLVKKNFLSVMIGYNMRFHPLMKMIKQIVINRELGNIYNVKSEWSEYLPDWHPREDYRKTYAARKEMGGGCSLTLSHELDSLYWLFGGIKKIFNIKTYKHLYVNVDTVSDFLIYFNNNIVGYSHIDFLKKPYERNLEISGTKKKLFFNYYKNEIKIVDRFGKIIKKKIKFEKNEMYKREIKYLLNCIKKKIKPKPDLKDSKYILKNFLSMN